MTISILRQTRHPNRRVDALLCRPLLRALGIVVSVGLACSSGPSSGTATGASESATSTSSTLTAATDSMTSGATMEADSSSSGVQSTGCSFVCPDAPQDPHECDLWLQDCPDGEKCIPYNGDGDAFWNDTKCFPVEPMPDALDEPCSAMDPGLSTGDSCEKGAVCWQVDPETGEGYCAPLCTGGPDEPQCPAGNYCKIEDLALDTVCLQLCHPLVQECKHDGVCVPQNARFVCMEKQRQVARQGAPCEDVNGCPEGLVCVSGQYVPGCVAPGCCTAWCDISNPDVCSEEGAECLPWFGESEPPSPFENVGFCGLPS